MHTQTPDTGNPARSAPDASNKYHGPDAATLTSREAYAFIQGLASEVSGGQLELPAFPDVVIRVRQALDDVDITPERLGRLVAADAGLTARVVAMANSAAFSRGGAAVTDLKTALIRIGMKNVRNAAMTFAVQQLRLASNLHHIRRPLEELWKDSTLTAALAYVIARHTRSVNADDALITGLLHNIGKVYIYSRLDPGSTLILDPDIREEILRDWHASVGYAIAESWQMPESVCLAISGQDESERDHVSRADLTDVLVVAISAARVFDSQGDGRDQVEDTTPFAKLGISHATWQDILAQSKDEIAELRAALGQ